MPSASKKLVTALDRTNALLARMDQLGIGVAAVSHTDCLHYDPAAGNAEEVVDAAGIDRARFRALRPGEAWEIT